jgi:hypothetical protein
MLPGARGEPDLEKVLPPEGYFLAGWQAMRAIDSQREEHKAALESLSFFEERLAHLPADLSGTAHISLMAETGRDGVEILRFIAQDSHRDTK